MSMATIGRLIPVAGTAAMNVTHLQRHFERIGARAKIREAGPSPLGPAFASDLAIDIGSDDDGEFFDFAIGRDADPKVLVLDVQPRLRHLLVLSDQSDGRHRFLCGHDERHWFVAGVPEKASASRVREAFDALKPPIVRLEEERLRVNPRRRNRRRNDAFVRQGEWFFVPISRNERPNEALIFRNEPISRGRGKPHLCEELVRDLGELVYVARRFPNGLTEQERERWFKRDPRLRKLDWRARRRNAIVYVRGRVRHPDHKTIRLDGWHRVAMNTENESAAMRHVVFLD